MQLHFYRACLYTSFYKWVWPTATTCRRDKYDNQLDQRFFVDYKKIERERCKLVVQRNATSVHVVLIYEIKV